MQRQLVNAASALKRRDWKCIWVFKQRGSDLTPLALVSRKQEVTDGTQ